MENNSQKLEDNFSKMIIKTIAGTLGLAVVLLVFALFAAVTFSPRSVIDFFNGIGEEHGAYAVYQKIYNKSKSSEDLYNVLNHAILIQKNSDIEKYSTLMLKSSDDFFAKTDEATIKMFGKKDSVYMSSYKSYVRVYLIRSTYNNLKKDEAKELAVSFFNEGDVSPMLCYLECVNNDERLIDVSRNKILKSLYEDGIYDKANDYLLSETFNVASVDNDFDAAVILNDRIKLNEIKYYIIKDTNENEAKSLQTEINNLVLALTALTSSMEN